MEMLNDGILSIDETEGEEISLTAELPSDQFTDEEKLQIESEKEDGDDEVKRIPRCFSLLGKRQDDFSFQHRPDLSIS